MCGRWTSPAPTDRASARAVVFAPRRPRRWRRGLTLLEVVFASVLLAMIALSLTSLLTSAGNHRARQAVIIGANEVANRLILQYLDDKNAMPTRGRAIEYGRHRFLWELVEFPVEMKEAAPRRTGVAASAPGGFDATQSRFREITVRIYAVDEARAAVAAAGATPRGDLMAELTRMYDPVHALLARNPDARRRRIEQSTSGIQDLLGAITGGDAAAAASALEAAGMAPPGSGTGTGRESGLRPSRVRENQRERPGDSGRQPLRRESDR